MPFRKCGFLGEQARQNIQNMRRRYSKLFRLVDEANEFIHDVTAEIRIDPYDVHQCFIGSLFAKMLNGYQSVIILSEYGLESDASIVLRALFDGIFLFGSTVEDRGFAEKYIEYQTKLNQLKKVNAAIDNAVDLKFDGEKITKLRCRKKELETDLGLNRTGDKKRKNLAAMFSSENLAKKAGLNAMYQSGYRILSDDVHTSTFSLERFLKIDSDGDRIKSIKVGPIYGEIKRNCSIATAIMLQALAGLCTLTGIDRDDELTKLQKKVADFDVGPSKRN